jgi:hypothetical protein
MQSLRTFHSANAFFLLEETVIANPAFFAGRSNLRTFHSANAFFLLEENCHCEPGVLRRLKQSPSQFLKRERFPRPKQFQFNKVESGGFVFP